MLSVLLFVGAAMAWGGDLPEVRTVSRVDLSRYAGEWFEQARLPMFFQNGCVASATSYRLLPDGALEVLNSCRDEKDGRLRSARGRGWVADPATNARLKVSFFWPFRTDYWIIDLGSEYEYAVVATPDRGNLWILSRQRRLPAPVLEGIIARLKEQRFPVEKLIWRREG